MSWPTICGTLEIANPELPRLESALLDFWSRRPGSTLRQKRPWAGGLEEQLLAEHLQRRAGPVAQSARIKARELFREKENEAWMERWQRIAGHLVERKAAAAQLREAEQAFASHFTDENWEHFLAARQHYSRWRPSETG